jgi:hypothetical protein
MTRWYDRLCDILLDDSKRVAFTTFININVKYTSILNLARGSVLEKRKGISLRFLHQRGCCFEAIFQTNTLRAGGGSYIIDVSQENARMEEI